MLNHKISFLILFSLLLGLQQVSLAQDNGLYHGFRFGVGTQTKLKNISSNEKIQEGITAQYGYAGNLQLLNWFGVDFGAFITNRSGELVGSFYDPISNSEVEYETTISAVSINVPVLPKYRFGKGDAKLKLMGGPSFNYLFEVGKSKSYSNEEYNSRYSYKNRKIEKQNVLEIELIGGIGLEMPIYAQGIISFDYHYHYPINSVGIVNGDKVKFVGSVFGITLMYKPQD